MERNAMSYPSAPLPSYSGSTPIILSRAPSRAASPMPQLTNTMVTTSISPLPHASDPLDEERRLCEFPHNATKVTIFVSNDAFRLSLVPIQLIKDNDGYWRIQSFLGLFSRESSEDTLEEVCLLLHPPIYYYD